MSLLFLVLDKSRENDRDAICAVMRQLLRKSFVFLPVHFPSQAGVTSIVAKKYTVCYRLFEFPYLSFADYILENSEDDTKSLFSIIKVGGYF